MIATPPFDELDSAANLRRALCETEDAQWRKLDPRDGNKASSAVRCEWSTLALGPPPERDWAISHWLGMGHVTLLAGKGGIGKTLIAQQLGSALPLAGRSLTRSCGRAKC